jgi:hypothetical protein
MIRMTDERDDEETQDPSDEELERTEAEFFEDAANEPVMPLERQILKAEGLFPPSIEDLDLIDAFPSRSPYMQEEWRISHALIRSTGVEKPTDLLEWWAPYRLLRPDELAEADYVADIDPLLIERGVAEGAARVKESFVIAPPAEAERNLLRLEPSDQAMLVTSEFWDQEGWPVLIKRQVIVSGGLGRVRDLLFEKEQGGTGRFEY